MSNTAIEFKDFSFQYREQAEPTLHSINLRIEKGEKVMIAGPSGCGKSTIGHCINGLIPHYYKGKITCNLYVNGQHTAKMDIFALSKHVGTVLQDAAEKKKHCVSAMLSVFSLSGPVPVSP